MGVKVRVGELVLEGFAPGEGSGVAEEIKHELAKLIRAGMTQAKTPAPPLGADRVRMQVTRAVQSAVKGRRGGR